MSEQEKDLSQPWTEWNMAQSDQWSHFTTYKQRLDKMNKRIKDFETRIIKMEEAVEKIYTMVANTATNSATTSQSLVQGGPIKRASAEPNQTNAKRRSLETQAKYAPEMTYDEMYKAKDLRWANGQTYRNNMELSFAFPKTMSPQEALHAASRERYWMNKNGAIEYIDNKYTLSDEWVDRFAE